MTAREISRALAYYTVVATAAACAATVAPIPFEGPEASAVTVAVVIVTAWVAIVVLDTVATRAKGGRP